jgi:tetratricopeptide (TPR) repeat protein
MRTLRIIATFMFACGLALCQQPARADEPQSRINEPRINEPRINEPPINEQSWAALHEAGVAAYEANRLNDALSALEAALPLATAPAQRAATLNDLGNCLRGMGRSAEALTNLKLAFAAWREVDPRGRYAAQTAMSLASMLRVLDRYGDAEHTLRIALDAHPREKKSEAVLLNSLGDLLREEVRTTEARGLFRTALKLLPDDEAIQIDALIGLADVERSSSEWRAAIGDFNRAIALSREAHRLDTEAIALRGLGKTYCDTGDLARAEPILKRALEMFETVPALRGQSAATLAYLGGVYRDEKKYRLAEDAFTRALDLRGGPERAAGPQGAAILELLAGVCALEKRFDDAGRYAAAALAIMKKIFPPDTPPIAGAIGAQAYVDEHAGDLEAADKHYSEALRIMRLNGVANSAIGADYMASHAQVLRRLHRAQDAKSLEIQVKAFRQSGSVNP